MSDYEITQEITDICDKVGFHVWTDSRGNKSITASVLNQNLNVEVIKLIRESQRVMKDQLLAIKSAFTKYESIDEKTMDDFIDLMLCYNDLKVLIDKIEE